MVLEAVRRTADKKRPIRLEKALTKAASDEGARKIALDAIAIEVGVATFLLDMWGEEPNRTHEEIITILSKTLDGLRDAVAIRIHPDQVYEILSGEAKAGFIFLPITLVLDLYRLGEMVSDITDGKGAGDKIEACGIRVMEAAAVWVQQCRQKWGIPPEWRLFEVRPPGPKDSEKKREEDPPF